jgi:hypothetical protein
MAIEFGGGLETRLYAGERTRLPLPARVVRKPLKRDLAGLAHVNEQPDDRALVLDLGLRDHAPHRERVEDLPHRLGVILGQNVDDGGTDAGDVDFGATVAFRFYVASYIKLGRWRLAIAIEAIAAGGYIVHVVIPFAGTSSRSLPAFFCQRPDQIG